MTTLRVGSLFAGIGGFDLAAEAVGWDTRWFCEWDRHCQHWLSVNFPDRPIYGDINTVDFSQVEPVDVLAGGFPCQPHSAAGKRQGTEDDRWLWPAFQRAIGQLRPRWVVVENVPGLLSVERGAAFGEVIRGLATLGYDARWDSLSAAECGAPHKRERLWIVAWRGDTDRRRCEQRQPHDRSDAISLAGQPAMGHAASERPGEARRLRSHRPEDGSTRRSEAVGDGQGRGRGAGPEFAARRADGGRESLGDPEQPGSQGLRRDGDDGREPGRQRAGAPGPTAAPRLRLHPWADAIPFRGADGTVRLIPAGAVGHAEGAGTGEREPERGWRPTEGARRGREELCGAEAVEGTQPALRALADGVSDNVARHGSAEEAKPWATPNERDHHAPGGDRTGHAQSAAHDAISFGRGGGSLWPVTESEPGRVARLKAIGNAIVPAWALNGPIRFILESERQHGADYGIEGNG